MFDVLLNEDERNIRDEVRRFVRDKVDRELILAMDSKAKEYPYEFIKAAAKENLLGLRFPKEYGGRGLGWVSEMVALEEIGVLGIALGCAYSLPSIVGEAIDRFGTSEQKKDYLLPTLQGKKICGEGLTEPRGGSDFFGTNTTAIKKDDVFIVNGEKRFVAGGVGADYFLVYAKTDFKAPAHEALSAFLVDRDMGVKVEEEYELMGCRGMGAARIVMRNVEVPVVNLVGELNDGNSIFNAMMVPERLTSAAGPIGMGRAAMEIAVRYADKREAFGRAIKKFEAISFKVADCTTSLDAARGLVYRAAKKADTGKWCRKEVSQAKVFATEAGFVAVHEAMQILGGIGYTDVYPIERLYRDARLATIWTGSNEVQRLIIQNEVFNEILAEDRSLKRDVELDTPGAYKTDEKVYTEAPNKYYPN
ncbi:MAG: acyl-CoA dehydrogenase [Candidatus Thorarchaeota archaeon SMTZ-45]|nr:MAG: acyl-CoA dehydrogenase [Candidatus Thorarchaeota archaeon SMTZ-45]KXH74511.1 MAG: acyl-CoA dehydrogenase [Candidatus Thorarchaeota archaeon SMTZ1-45]